MRSGALTTGELLVVLSYLRDLQSPVRGLVRLAAVRAKAAAGLQRLAEVLGCTEAVSVPVAPTPVPPVRDGLRLDGWFGYRPDRPVLDGFDLDGRLRRDGLPVRPQRRGQEHRRCTSCCASTTPRPAGCCVDGVDVRELDPVALRHRLAFVPQDPWLLDGTLAENIAFAAPGATRGGRAGRRPRRPGSTSSPSACRRATTRPLGESGVLLSGGQRRRVALARAVVSTAPVVLLDEPTTSLDAEAADQVIGAIRSAARDRTVLLVTHDPRLAAIADRIVRVGPLRRAAGSAHADPARPTRPCPGIAGSPVPGRAPTPPVRAAPDPVRKEVTSMSSIRIVGGVSVPRPRRTSTAAARAAAVRAPARRSTEPRAADGPIVAAPTGNPRPVGATGGVRPDDRGRNAP